MQDTKPNQAERLAQEIVERNAAAGERPSAHQISDISQRIGSLVSVLKQEQELRKWCVEQARGDIAAAQNIFSFVTDSKKKVVEMLDS